MQSGCCCGLCVPADAEADRISSTVMHSVMHLLLLHAAQARNSRRCPASIHPSPPEADEAIVRGRRRSGTTETCLLKTLGECGIHSGNSQQGFEHFLLLKRPRDLYVDKFLGCWPLRASASVLGQSRTTATSTWMLLNRRKRVRSECGRPSPAESASEKTTQSYGTLILQSLKLNLNNTFYQVDLFFLFLLYSDSTLFCQVYGVLLLLYE